MDDNRSTFSPAEAHPHMCCLQDVGFDARNALQRRRCASAILALPPAVLGPVDSPPWNRQRRFPGTTLMMHGAPARVLAQHLGRYLRFKGSPLGDRPRSSICRHQCLSRQVTSRHARPVPEQRTTVVIETNSMFAGISLRPHDAHARVLLSKGAGKNVQEILRLIAELRPQPPPALA